MSVLNDGIAFAKGILGIRVDRATANLPQTAAAAIFTIATGRVVITSIVGEVTTVIQTQTDNAQLTFDPTAAGATQDLCADLDITADAVGTIYSITGTPATAMQDSLNFLPPNKGLANPLILKPGQILLDCSAGNTGQVKWSITYVPLDDGATVVAA
jgi:hypothetical protein